MHHKHKAKLGLTALVLTTVAALLATSGAAEAADEGSIFGWVVDDRGWGVEDVAVDLFTEVDGARGEYVRSARTERSGRFTLPAGNQCYIITYIAKAGATFATGSRWVTRGPFCLNASEDQWTPDVVHGPPGDAGIISGAVEVAGQDTPQTQVDLFAANADGSRGRWLDLTNTDANGDGGFEFRPEPGCYVLTFIAPEDAALVGGSPEGQYLNRGVCVDSGETAIVNAEMTIDGGPPPPPSGGPSLERGVNFAGDFEVDPRGSWGTSIEAYFFDVAVEGGFDHVRIPIKWSAHRNGNDRIDEDFFEEVDWLVAQANRAGLTIVLDMHFFEEMDENPSGLEDAFVSMWTQIGERYADEPNTVVFELYNEPIGVFNDNPATWNRIAARALAAVRVSNPTRTVIIGPVAANHPSALNGLSLPDDNNLVATIHNYDPSTFTHQSAPWAENPPPSGQTWDPSRFVLNLDWLNFSWPQDDPNTPEAEPAIGFEGLNNGMRVSPVAQWNGMSLATDNGRTESYDEAVLVVDRNDSLAGQCNTGEPSEETVDFVSEANGDGTWTLTADLSPCGEVGRFSIMFAEPNPSPILFQRADLCRGQDCEALVLSAIDAMDAQMERAANWASANGVDLYLGEFGVYDHPSDPVDRQSRLLWTQAMRESAELFDVGWSYFELSNDFAVYNHDARRFDAELLAALMGTPPS